MPGAHAKYFRPSSAAQIIDCPASLLHTIDLPDETRYDAAWGTAAHTLAERILTQGGVASMFIGEIIEVDGFKIEVDDEMAETVTRYVAVCAITPGDHYVETRVDISRWCPVPDQFGTADFAACAPGLLNIKDLKGGKGVQVFADNNPQAALYALGFINEWDWLYDFQKIVVEIVQPRLDWYDQWETTKDELLAFGERIKERFTLAMQPDAPFGATEKACKFCKLSGACRAQAEHLNAISALAFDDITAEFEHDAATLTVDEMVHAWRVRKLYSNRLNEIERKLVQRMMHGDPVPLKTVEGKTRRRWKNEEEARNFLTQSLQLDLEDIAPRKLVSPSKVEKRMPPQVKKSLEPLWMKPPGRPSLAELTDKRVAYEVKNLEAFDVVEDEATDE